MPDYYDEYDYYEDDSYDFGGLPPDQQREFLYETIGFDSLGSDFYLHDLFWSAMYDNELTNDERDAAYEALNDYIWSEYGIEFDLVWDWEDFRDWYAAA